MKFALTALTTLLYGCGAGGLMTGDDQEPDAYAKQYHFKGKVNMEAGVAPFASGETDGDLEVCGVVVYGEMPKEAVATITTSLKNCARP